MSEDLGEFSCTVSRNGAVSIWIPALKDDVFMEFYIEYNPDMTNFACDEDVTDYCFNIKMYSLADDSPTVGTAIISEDTLIVDFALDSALSFIFSRAKN